MAPFLKVPLIKSQRVSQPPGCEHLQEQVSPLGMHDLQAESFGRQSQKVQCLTHLALHFVESM